MFLPSQSELDNLATSINISIPANTPSGIDTYKIRITGSNPVVFGEESPTFTINNISCVGRSWYDAGWAYRRAVSITNSGSTMLTDYQVKFTLNNSAFNFSQANLDGSDVRITLADGVTEIPYWIEEWDTTNQAILWVRIPNIPTTGTTIFMYYGNTQAGSMSDGVATFRFFDDFEDWSTSPGSSGWTDKADLPVPIADQTSAVWNGKIFSIGGYGNGPTDPKNENFEFDPVSNSWTAKTAMPTSRWGMVAVEFDGKFYVFGGLKGVGTATGVNKNEVYDPVTDSWDTTKSVIPSGLADEGVMGIRVGTKIHLFHLSSHYEYDPANDTYTAKSSMPTPRYWCTSALIGSKIYLIAGYGVSSVSNKHEVYDVNTDAWKPRHLYLSVFGGQQE
ncbi:MAG: DUF2341 domain-containing protein [Bacteroidales bacterium]|nr:DUF2341 domain-containing protein [Bacteroidales bacterium]